MFLVVKYICICGTDVAFVHVVLRDNLADCGIRTNVYAVQLRKCYAQKLISQRGGYKAGALSIYTYLVESLVCLCYSDECADAILRSAQTMIKISGKSRLANLRGFLSLLPAMGTSTADRLLRPASHEP